MKVRVVLPHHLRNLAGVASEFEIDVAGPVSVASILDAVEAAYPVLQGTIREHVTLKRRPFLRFFACGEDVSQRDPNLALPEAISSGREAFMVVGAIAGG